MESYIVLAIAFTVCVVGIILIMRMLKTLDENGAMPMTDMQEIQGLDDGLSTQNQTTTMQDALQSPLVGHMLKENLSTEQQSSDQASQSGESTALIASLKKENEDLKVRLEKEASNKASETVDEGQGELLDDLKKQLDHLKNANDELSKENVDLKQEKNSEESSKAAQQSSEDALQEELKSIQGQKETLEKNLQLLESELERIKQEAEQGKQTQHEIIEQLRNEKFKFTDQMSKVEEQQTVLQDEINIKQDEYKVRIKEAREEVAEEEIKKGSAVKNQLSLEIQEMTQQLNDVNSEFDRIQREKINVEIEMEKVKDYNRNLQEKEQMLQYELTKSRAEACGLEKICEDFKVQIEQGVS